MMISCLCMISYYIVYNLISYYIVSYSYIKFNIILSINISFLMSFSFISASSQRWPRTRALPSSCPQPSLHLHTARALPGAAAPAPPEQKIDSSN